MSLFFVMKNHEGSPHKNHPQAWNQLNRNLLDFSNILLNTAINIYIANIK